MGSYTWSCGTTRIVAIDPQTNVFTTVVDGARGVRCVAADKQGNIYAGLGDPENQVQVFKSGRHIRDIGSPGGATCLAPGRATASAS